MIWVQFETPSFKFDGFAADRNEAETLIIRAWVEHAVNADPAYILEFWNDVVFHEIHPGMVFKDNEEMELQ